MNVFCGVDKLTISRAAVARQIGLTPSAVSKPVSRARLDALSEEVAAFVLNDKEGGQGFRKED
jgi:predicted transcriptional regulator